nr:ABC transporter substrate-binding protein [Lentibacillus saliphilus]
MLSGCGSDDDQSENNNATNDNGTEQAEDNGANNNETESEDEASAFPYTINDASGEDVTIEKAPERIVSVIPSNTEIAFALGLDEEIVGVSDHDDYPEAATEKEKVGGLELNIEAIIALDPDLVLAEAGNPEAAIKQLRDSGMTVLVVPTPTDFAGVYDNITMLGKATGTYEKAEEIVTSMQADLAALQEKTKDIPEADRKQVFIEISPSPEIYTAGKGTFFDQLLNVINATNAAGGEEGWPMLDQEAIIALNPDVIITTYGNYVADPHAEVADRDGWSDVTAIQNDAIYDVDTNLVSRPGPRLVEGAKVLGKAIYPDVFQD